MKALELDGSVGCLGCGEWFEDLIKFELHKPCKQEFGMEGYDNPPTHKCLTCGKTEGVVCDTPFSCRWEMISNDPVDKPQHYTNGSIECIDAIQAALTPEEFRGFLKGQVMKYVWREKLKGGNEDLAKAGWYLERLQKVSRVQGGNGK